MKSFTKVVWWIVLAVGLAGIALMSVGCVSVTDMDACARMCASTGVKTLNWLDECVCNPPMSTKVEFKSENCK